MNKKTTLTLAALIFTAVALLHLLRYILGWNLTINDFETPDWVSIFGTIIPAILAFQLFKLRKN